MIVKAKMQTVHFQFHHKIMLNLFFPHWSKLVCFMHVWMAWWYVVYVYTHFCVCVWYVIRCLFMVVITMQKKKKKIFFCFLCLAILFFCRAIAILTILFSMVQFTFFSLMDFLWFRLVKLFGNMVIVWFFLW